MNSSNCSCVCSPRASASSIALRSASMSLTACMSSRRGVLAARPSCPWNWLSRTSRRSRSSICLVRRPRLGAAPVVVGLSACTARAVSVGSVSSSISAMPGAVGRVGEQRRRSGSSACSSSSRTSCSVPSSRPFCRACALPLGDLAAQVVEPAQPVGAAAQQVAQRLPRAGAVEHRARRSRRAPTATSYGGSSGSRPPDHEP